MNLQNIPSHNKSIRMMFKASSGESEINENNGWFKLDKWSELQTIDGWIKVKDITKGTKVSETEYISEIKEFDSCYVLVKVSEEE